MYTTRLSRLLVSLTLTIVLLALLLAGLTAAAVALPQTEGPGKESLAVAHEHLTNLPDQPLPATQIPSISNIIGATYDEATGEMLVFGIADPNFPGMDYAYIRDNLVVALRAFYDPIAPDLPGVSIEGTLDPLSVIYFGGVTNTHMGRVSFESDRLLKIYTLGKDNLTGLTVTSTVAGYQSYPDRMTHLAETVLAPSPIRYFFTPTLSVEPITSPHSIIFSRTQGLVDWAYLGPITSTASTQAAQGFIDNFNQHYFDYAFERRAAYSDTTLYEVVQLSKLSGIAQWAHDNEWDLELNGINSPWLSRYPLPYTTTVTRTPGITVTWVQTISGTPYQLSLRGGVYLPGTLIQVNAPVQDQLLARGIHDRCTGNSCSQVFPIAVVKTDPGEKVFEIESPLIRPMLPGQVSSSPTTEGPVVVYVIPLAGKAVVNGNFESGPSAPWAENSDFEMIMTDSPHSGVYGAIFPIYDNAHVSMSQTLYIPTDATMARLTYWWAATTEETDHPWDWFASFLSSSSGQRLKTFETLSDANADGYWHQKSFDVISYTGQTVQLWFTATTDSSNITYFFLDDISLDYLDLIPPAVVTCTHAPQPVPLSAPTEFTLTFRERMNTSILPTVTLHLQNSQTTYTVTPKIANGYSQGYPGNDPTQWHGVFTFTPQMPEGLYELDVAHAQDLAGNVMYPVTRVYTLPFNSIPPQVLGNSPTNGASNVANNASVVITFSEPISTSTFNYTVIPNPGGWSANWDGAQQVVTLLHTPFASDTVYTVTIQQARDLAGNPLVGAPVSWSFATAIVDTTAPQVVDKSPASGAGNVATNASVVITFSEPISTSTFNYTVIPDPGGWSANWDSAKQIVTLTHNLFALGTVYTATIQQAQDPAGNPLVGAPITWSFTTAIVDTTAPQVLGNSPANGASDVATNASVVITFSEPISTSTFSYTVIPDPGGWSVNWDSAKQIVVLTHNLFALGTVYTATIQQAQDLAGNPLVGAPSTWSFTTAIVDTTAPQVVDKSPASGAGNVATNASVVITFSEPISTSTFNYTVIPDPGGWSANWDGAQQVVTLLHAPFASGTVYTITVQQARDLAGNPLAGTPVAWWFFTRYSIYLPAVIKF